jgi:mRNA interferase RelE/StbE
MEYIVEFRAAALSGLEQISQKNQKRILRKIYWLTDNFNQLSPQPLTGDLSGLFKLRIGDYRALYSFSEETQIITFHRIGHRSEIYL